MNMQSQHLFKKTVGSKCFNITMGWSGGLFGKVLFLQARGAQFDPTDPFKKKKPGINWGAKALDRQARRPGFKSPAST